MQTIATGALTSGLLRCADSVGGAKGPLQEALKRNTISSEGLLSPRRGLPVGPLFNTGMYPNVVYTMYRSTVEFHIYFRHVPGAAKMFMCDISS